MADTLMEDGGELLSTLGTDLKRLKGQKARASGGVEGRILLNLCFLNDEQYVNYGQKSLYSEPQDDNKLYLSFNLIGPRVSKLIGRLASTSYDFKARPDKKDPKALEEAEVIDRLIIALDEKLDQPSKIWEHLFWLIVGGVSFEYTPWIPNAVLEPKPVMTETGELTFKDLMTGEVMPESAKDQMVEHTGRAPESFEVNEEVQEDGEVGSVVLGPLNVFIDQTVKSVKELPPDQWVHIAQIKTTGWIEENYGQEVEPDKDFAIISSNLKQAGPALGGTFLKDLIPLIQGSADDNDPPMCLYVESYQPKSKKFPRGRFACWVPGKVILHAGDNPYEEVPLIDVHFKPVTTSFWTQDYISGLIAPQRFINKRISQLGEQANAVLYSQLLLGGALTEKDIPADKPGAIKGSISDSGAPLVQRLAPPELPAWFMPSIDMAIKVFNDTAGGADLLEDSKFPGQLRGPLAVPMLQEILDTSWGPLFMHLGKRFAEVKNMRLKRVGQFYPPIRTMHYTGKDQKDDVLTFHSEILKGATTFSVTVDRASLVPELRALRESRVKERLSGPLAILYMDERTGKLDKSKIASDLQFGDTGREDRESQYRKLAQEIIDMVWEAKQIPPVLPFYDHAVMLDELESAMATTEFLHASPQVQTLFNTRWEQHRFYLQQEATAQQQAMMAQSQHQAVAQATQQAAAMAAADAVTEARTQVHAQNNTQPGAEETTRAAFQQQGERPPASHREAPPAFKGVANRNAR
jgi:hypothetical protein